MRSHSCSVNLYLHLIIERKSLPKCSQYFTALQNKFSKNNFLTFHTGHPVDSVLDWISFHRSWPVLTNFRLKRHTDALSS